MRKQPLKLALAAAFGLALTFTLSCSSGDDNNNGGGGGSCSINGGTVKIGSQTWMSENLNCYVVGSKCYDDDPANCAKYGRLYNWSTAMALPDSCNRWDCASKLSEKHRGICPSGWHIPSNADWNVLMKSVNPSCSGNADCAGAGTKLKATSDWSNDGSGTDEFGFSALPGGLSNSVGYFSNVGIAGFYLSASEEGGDGTYPRVMLSSDEDVHFGLIDKSYLLNVRCVKD